MPEQLPRVRRAAADTGSRCSTACMRRRPSQPVFRAGSGAARRAPVALVWSQSDLTAGGAEYRCDQPWTSVRLSPIDVHVTQHRLEAAAEPVVDPAPIAGKHDLQELDLMSIGRRVDRRVAEPSHEERQLRVHLQVLDAKLLPFQRGAIGQVTMAVDRRPSDSLLDRTKIIDRDHPAQPTTAGL